MVWFQCGEEGVRGDFLKKVISDQRQEGKQNSQVIGARWEEEIRGGYSGWVTQYCRRDVIITTIITTTNASRVLTCQAVF